MDHRPAVAKWGQQWTQIERLKWGEGEGGGTLSYRSRRPKTHSDGKLCFAEGTSFFSASRAACPQVMDTVRAGGVKTGQGRGPFAGMPLEGQTSQHSCILPGYIQKRTQAQTKPHTHIHQRRWDTPQNRGTCVHMNCVASGEDGEGDGRGGSKKQKGQ